MSYNMLAVEQRLFDTYGETILREMGHGFDEAELEKWLGTFPIDGKVRYRIVDGLLDYYQHWAPASFAVGFRLGLALLHDDIRRFRPEKV